MQLKEQQLFWRAPAQSQIFTSGSNCNLWSLRVTNFWYCFFQTQQKQNSGPTTATVVLASTNYPLIFPPIIAAPGFSNCLEYFSSSPKVKWQLHLDNKFLTFLPINLFLPMFNPELLQRFLFRFIFSQGENFIIICSRQFYFSAQFRIYSLVQQKNRFLISFSMKRYKIQINQDTRNDFLF